MATIARVHVAMFGDAAVTADAAAHSQQVPRHATTLPMEDGVSEL